MSVFRIALFLSAAGLLAGAVLPGAQGLAYLAGPSLVVSLVFLELAARRAHAPVPTPMAGRPWVLVDGSNVMHWREDRPDLGTLRVVIDQLVVRGFSPGVVFDANAGYKTVGTFQNDQALSARLGLPPGQVFVVPRGEQADHYLLSTAQSMGAPIVTNDRFRDWADRFPEVANSRRLIRGRFEGGVLRLEYLPGEGRPPQSADLRLSSR